MVNGKCAGSLHSKWMEVKDLINSLEGKKNAWGFQQHISGYERVWDHSVRVHYAETCRNSVSLLDLVMLRHEFGAYQEQMMNSGPRTTLGIRQQLIPPGPILEKCTMLTTNGELKLVGHRGPATSIIMIKLP